MKKTAALLCCLIMFSICVSVFADTLYLKNGNQFEGRVVRHDDEKLTFKIGEEEDGVDVTFFNDEILRIDKAEISSFITLPFGSDQQVDIPRPVFEKEPVVTDATTEAIERRQKASAGEGLENADDAKEKIDEGKNLLPEELQSKSPQETKEFMSKMFEAMPSEVAEKMPPDAFRQMPTNMMEQMPADAIEQMSPQMAEDGLNVTRRNTSYRDVGRRINDSSNFNTPFRSVTEELTQLLDQDEKRYFTTINAVMHDIAGQMAVVLSDPDALAGGDEVLAALEKEMPSQIGKAIETLRYLSVPELFVNFHKQYLGNLEMMKGMFLGMSVGDRSDSQAKVQELQSAQAKLQDELRNILAIKKRQRSS